MHSERKTGTHREKDMETEMRKEELRIRVIKDDFDEDDGNEGEEDQ